MYKHKKVICYYHEDMDGIASASIIKDIYPNAKFIGVNYGDDWNVLDVMDSYTIIVDFSFPNMEELNQYPDKLCWIDHHKTAMDMNTELWNNKKVDGIRDLSDAGCVLTWKHFHPNNKTIPTSIILIGDRDMWRFKHEETKAFHEYVSLKFKHPNINLVFLTGDKVLECIEIGNIILEKKKEQVRQSYENGTDIIFNGHKTRAINTNFNVSDTGQLCYKNGYAVALIWSIRDGRIVCSLRSDTVDVGKLAEQYGGGGHKFASGFSVDMVVLDSILNEKHNKL